MYTRAAIRLSVAILVFILTPTVVHAVLMGVYEFDGGGDGTSWDDRLNWEQVLDPDGLPISGDPATPPSAVTSAEIPLAGVVVNSAGQTALDVRIGGTAGTLDIDSGQLTVRDMFVGSGNPGALSVSGGTLDAADDITIGNGSVGTMTMSNGAASTADDFVVNANSSFTMTGGTLFVGDRLSTSANASLLVNGGNITADDDFFFFGSSQITVDSGSMIVFDKLRFDDVLTTGKLTINSGLVRSQEFGFLDSFNNYIMNGTVEINGDGYYQSEAPDVSDPFSQLSVAAAKALIADGTFITTEALMKLDAFSVVVPEFDGRTNVGFTQISLVSAVPEPASVLLLGLGGFGLLLRRQRAR